MGLFDFLKKGTTPQQQAQAGPYRDSATNMIYELLYCDKPELYKANTQPPYTYPFDILFSEESTTENLQQIIDDKRCDSRLRMLAYNRQAALGQAIQSKELLGVIIEVGLDRGLDVLAAFSDGKARYINQTGKIIIWETNDANSDALINELFSRSRNIVNQIGPWNAARKNPPVKENLRISFLVANGLYFGEGPIDVMFKDGLAGPALAVATQLMKYLTERAAAQNK